MMTNPMQTRWHMIAQFFGENGDNADTITALGLWKFLDRQYRVVGVFGRHVDEDHLIGAILEVASGR